jgi:hypothetical protein
MCFDFRKKFYSYPSIFRRGCDVRGNCNGFFKAGVFFSLNMLARKEVGQRYGLPLGRR